MNTIPPQLQPKLWAYIAGIARNRGMHPVAIGGTGDHIHALIALPPVLCVANAVQLLKAIHLDGSAKIMSESFEWREGYGAFSVSKSQLPVVAKYIANQADHHKERDFNSEFLSLLRKHGIEL